MQYKRFFNASFGNTSWDDVRYCIGWDRSVDECYECVTDNNHQYLTHTLSTNNYRVTIYELMSPGTGGSYQLIMLCPMSTTTTTSSIITNQPTDYPTNPPTDSPTNPPTVNPTIIPTKTPTINPTVQPTIIPTKSPTINPTVQPTIIPTNTPITKIPTNIPTNAPITKIQTTTTPTHQPTAETIIYSTNIPSIASSVNFITADSAEPSLFSTYIQTESILNIPASTGNSNINCNFTGIITVLYLDLWIYLYQKKKKRTEENEQNNFVDGNTKN